MEKNEMLKLAEFGQSIWLDNINRKMLRENELKNLIIRGLRGMTSNPSIFKKSISSSEEYDERISQLSSISNTPFEIYDELTIADIQDAADFFRSVFDQTKGLDGYVSLEINPQMAHGAKNSIEEGIRLFNKVNRPNIMIKVPATEAGYLVIEELILRKINVNVTLIFSLEQYKNAFQAYLRGLERLAQASEDLSQVHSVASVFVSRIDAVVDQLIEERLQKFKEDSYKAKLQYCCGKAAVANCRMIYDEYQKLLKIEAFQELKKKRANVQRVLWASTSTKNPAYSDIKYVTELMAKNTVNTLPNKTLDAFVDHGEVKEAFCDNPQIYQEVLDSLKEFNIDVDQVCQELLKKGVQAFITDFEDLLRTIEQKAQKLSTEKKS